MNRNSESHFANIPTTNIGRSKWNRSFTHKTTFSEGELIPIFVDTTIMPGDSVKMNMSEIVREMTPIAPVMDNANLDLYWFFTPYRLVWDHWVNFMGENTNGPWVEDVEYTVPQTLSPGDNTTTEVGISDEVGWLEGSLADYFGLPTQPQSGSRKDYSVSSLPFRAYCLIWNEWFRDENLQTPCYITKGDGNTLGHSLLFQATEWDNEYLRDRWLEDSEYVKYAETGAKPLQVNKYHDYFTSCLPNTQKSKDPVRIPLSEDGGNKLPVKLGIVDENKKYIYPDGTTELSASSWNDNLANLKEPAYLVGHKTTEGQSTGALISTETTGTTNLEFATLLDNNTYMNYMIDLNDAVGATVNQLRQAFAIQKFFERQAYGGSRYIEMIKSHFKTTNPDFRMQRPEYLGGKRIPINMNQVISTSYANPLGNEQPLGTTGAYSVTADRSEMFTHSFTEHGVLMCLACIRVTHSYQQGINAMWSKKKLFDFYFPELANLGMQPVLNKEIFLTGSNGANGEQDTTDEEAFGYQEAWATERYFPDIVTGLMRSNADSGSLDIWHYADDYEELPTLSSTWILEEDTNINRTLAVQNQDQFLADFYFDAKYTRPMPLYSVPGLIDHH